MIHELRCFVIGLYVTLKYKVISRRQCDGGVTIYTKAFKPATHIKLHQPWTGLVRQNPPRLHGHPYRFHPRSTLLNFSGQTGTGAFNDKTEIIESFKFPPHVPAPGFDNLIDSEKP